MADFRPVHHHHHQLNSVNPLVETVRMDVSWNILGLSTYLFLQVLNLMAKGRGSSDSLRRHSQPGRPLYQSPIIPGPDPSLW